MNAHTRHITRASERIGARLIPSNETAQDATYLRTDLERLLRALRAPAMSSSHHTAGVLRILDRALTQPTDASDDVTIGEQDLRIIQQNLRRIETAVDRARKLDRGIIPGALSAREATRVMARMIGHR